MQAFKRQILAALMATLILLPVPQVRAELIATTGETKIVSLLPLRNGLSAITLVWPIDPLTEDHTNALTASLSSVVSGGTSSRSAYEIDTFLHIKGIGHTTSANGRNLSFTVTAPDDVFPEALKHLENLLLEPEYSKGWYERELQKILLKNSTKTGRPSDVLNEVAHFLVYEPDDEATSEGNGKIRFGRPRQVVLRAENPEIEDLAIQLIRKLPKAGWESRIANWATSLTRKDKRAFRLPVGTIHFADPDSSEMLVLFVKAQEFERESELVNANLLIDYIGDNSGSEMFRIIRQEMRAAYDPRSDFVVMDKNRAIISLSATVEAANWPENHGKIKEIYENVRAGKIDPKGLEIQHDQLKRAYSNRLFNDPVWGAQYFLSEYPEGVNGDIFFPIFEALKNAPPDKIIANSETYLPPLEEFLLILVGGGTAPADTLKSKGYCALPKNTPLEFCLDDLSSTLN